MEQTWKDFCAGVNKVAGKAAVKLEEFSDSAAKYMREKSLDVKLCEAYEKLGRLYYAQLNGQPSKADKIHACMEEIDNLRAQIADIKAQAAPKKGKSGGVKAEDPAAEEETIEAVLLEKDETTV